MPLGKVTAGQQQISLYLCHICEGEIGRRAFLVILDNFKELGLPLHRHIELGVITSIVVEREGHKQSLSIGVVLIWKKA